MPCQWIATHRLYCVYLHVWGRTSMPYELIGHTEGIQVHWKRRIKAAAAIKHTQSHTFHWRWHTHLIQGLLRFVGLGTGSPSKVWTVWHTDWAREVKLYPPWKHLHNIICKPRVPSTCAMSINQSHIHHGCGYFFLYKTNDAKQSKQQHWESSWEVSVSFEEVSVFKVLPCVNCIGLVSWPPAQHTVCLQLGSLAGESGEQKHLEWHTFHPKNKSNVPVTCSKLEVYSTCMQLLMSRTSGSPMAESNPAHTKTKSGQNCQK